LSNLNAIGAKNGQHAMNIEQMSVVALLVVAMGLFIWNHWRYDVVAGFVLITGVFIGVVPTEQAFDGFSHPAVITVASVLVISQALQSSGVDALFLHYLARARGTLTKQLIANCTVTAVLSAFMNNIGALALMLPITIRDARKAQRSASQLLMPLSFASLLGGLVTLIGTPPNIIVSSFRAEQIGQPFGMFDFTPVGLIVALSGITFIVSIGWRFLPDANKDNASESREQFSIARYVTELRIPKESALAEATVRDLEILCENDVSVMAIIRSDRRRLAPSSVERLQAGDVLIMEGDSESLQPLFENPGLVEAGAEITDPNWFKSPHIRIIEAVVMPNAAIIDAPMRGLKMHQHYAVNLLAVAREGRASRSRLQHVRFKAGDVLLLQGATQALEQMGSTLGCLAIKNRGVEIVPKRGSFQIPAIFGAGIIAAAAGFLPVQLAFTAVVGALVLLKLVSLREAYRSIEWPVIVLLGFLIPVGEALHSTGTTDLIAQGMLLVAPGLPIWIILCVLMIISMMLADLIHNSPTALIMAPIAYSLSTNLSLSADPFLMAVAIGAASPYLTPIGHQSNTLVMGPGGYNFKDYWRLGLPLDVVIVIVGVPMILWVWL
jgi:di/tricarboxylate transporter